MAIAIINASYVQQREEQKVSAQHLWYDTEAEWLITVTGGRLGFDYDQETGKTKMSVFDTRKVTYKTANNYENIMNWYRSNKDDFALEIVDGGSGMVAFSFPDEMKAEIDEALYFNRFDYEIM